ncbi:ribbon-helix-helix domain-containing protein [Glycomyces niveus]|uniref:Ribbon-helix-helix protein, CopG family n=1 Tax=Glycomyces niveus TaxID=2820287 RepID=A0ABS3U8F7_9ACTN|nr:CopG family transcriptional regulator [Glycomyces sp. NEAU-S30]MBO3733982.1 ribbon-helix-helix protein, CopG family [Glycomyces sp. NEAU-S30]
MKQASTYLTEDELAQLDRHARARGISRAAMIHELVTDYLKERAVRPKRVSTFDFGGPVSREERRRIIGEAYENRADRR